MLNKLFYTELNPSRFKAFVTLVLIKNNYVRLP